MKQDSYGWKEEGGGLQWEDQRQREKKERGNRRNMGRTAKTKGHLEESYNDMDCTYPLETSGCYVEAS